MFYRVTGEISRGAAGEDLVVDLCLNRHSVHLIGAVSRATSDRGRASVELPGRDQPREASIDGLCEELVARVRPGGLTPRVAEPAPAILDGRYTLLHRLGAGGMGEVWCAEHVGLGKRVAIKFLQAALASDAKLRSRFLREGRVASAVRHPSVVDILDVGEAQDGRVYLVMELIEGRTLADVVREERPFSWPRARAVLVELARALACVHEHGVIHRDIKPSNVMLVGVGDDGRDRCKLIDFGLARGELGLDASVEVTSSGAILGSPAYMSPEQFRGQTVDARSDIYSFGCLAYFLLTGKPPFDGATPAQQMYQHLMLPFPALEHVAVRKWLNKACSKNPAHRYADMHELLAAMPLADGRAVSRSRARTWRTGAALVAFAGLTTSFVVTREETPAVEHVASAAALPTTSPAPEVSTETIVSIHAGKDFTCAVTSAGRLRCWGSDGAHLCQPHHRGHLGDDELPHVVPALDFGARRVVDLSVGFLASHVCAVLDDGSVRCWGSDASEQLGSGPGIKHWCDQPGESLSELAPLSLPHTNVVSMLETTTCALTGLERNQGAVWCWGPNTHGQLGIGNTDPLAHPPATPVELGGAHVRQLSVGVANVCVLLDYGGVRCWGGNRNLHLGAQWPADLRVGDGVGNGVLGARPDSPELDVQGLDDFEVALVRANGGWNCIASVDGRVRCWGGNDDGAMGYRHDQIPDCDPKRHGYDCLMPTPSLDLQLGARAVDLQMGRKHGCVLDDRGAVRCWGWGVHGSLGYGRRLVEATGQPGIGHHNTPAQAYAAMGNGGIVDIGDFDRDGNIDAVRQMAMGYSHSCVLVEDGSVRCWGRNAEGQLGYGSTDDVGDDETPAEYYASHECGAVPLFEGEGCS